MAPTNAVVHLKVPAKVANTILDRIGHGLYQAGLRSRWKVDEDGGVDARSACWLYCWAKADAFHQATAGEARSAFDAIMDIDFRSFDLVVPLEDAQTWREPTYARDKADYQLRALLDR